MPAIHTIITAKLSTASYTIITLGHVVSPFCLPGEHGVDPHTIDTDTIGTLVQTALCKAKLPIQHMQEITVKVLKYDDPNMRVHTFNNLRLQYPTIHPSQP